AWARGHPGRAPFQIQPERQDCAWIGARVRAGHLSWLRGGKGDDTSWESMAEASAIRALLAVADMAWSGRVHAHGFVNLLRLISSQGKLGHSLGPPHPLGGPLYTCDFGPTLESFSHLLAIVRCRQEMPSGSEVLGNGAIRRQKTLGIPGGF